MTAIQLQTAQFPGQRILIGQSSGLLIGAKAQKRSTSVQKTKDNYTPPEHSLFNKGIPTKPVRLVEDSQSNQKPSIGKRAAATALGLGGGVLAGGATVVASAMLAMPLVIPTMGEALVKGAAEATGLTGASQTATSTATAVTKASTLSKFGKGFDNYWVLGAMGAGAVAGTVVGLTDSHKKTETGGFAGATTGAVAGMIAGYRAAKLPGLLGMGLFGGIVGGTSGAAAAHITDKTLK